MEDRSDDQALARSILLTGDELAELTGYRQASAQMKELLRRGFVRARRGSAGQVILERAHYEAVCRGTYGVCAETSRVRPKLRPLEPEPQVQP